MFSRRRSILSTPLKWLKTAFNSYRSSILQDAEAAASGLFLEDLLARTEPKAVAADFRRWHGKGYPRNLQRVNAGLDSIIRVLATDPVLCCARSRRARSN